jgi:histidinol phosphatase-like PHP family hydrolase
MTDPASAVVTHDVHVHTVLSACCQDASSTPASILARAAEAGLRVIGFADHLWDSAVPGASDWYRPQDLAHVLRIRQEIPADTRGVRVLVGCETEYCGGGKVGISRQAARQLDYVLIPFSHTHMTGFVVPDGTTAAHLPRLLTQRFREVLDLDLATGIAHPFLPLAFMDRLDEVMAAVPDAELEDCFGRAAARRVSIEIHVGMFPGPGGGEKGGLHDETFLRVLGIAKRMGCLFHFASDAHELKDIGAVRKLEPYAQALGISQKDIHPVFR